MKLEAKNSGTPNLSRRNFLKTGAGLAVASILGGISGCDKSGDIKANTPFSIATESSGGMENIIKYPLQRDVDRIILDLYTKSSREKNYGEHIVQIEAIPGKAGIFILTIKDPSKGIQYTCNNEKYTCESDKDSSVSHFNSVLKAITGRI